MANTFAYVGGQLELSFDEKAAIQILVIPDTVNRIEPKVFSNCPRLERIEFSPSTTTIGILAFLCCPSLTTVTLPVNMERIGDRAFYGCRNLVSITIQGNRLLTIGHNAFFRTSLRQINMACMPLSILPLILIKFSPRNGDHFVEQSPLEAIGIRLSGDADPARGARSIIFHLLRRNL